jgi:hypothetical protein
MGRVSSRWESRNRWNVLLVAMNWWSRTVVMVVAAAWLCQASPVSHSFDTKLLYGPLTRFLSLLLFFLDLELLLKWEKFTDRWHVPEKSRDKLPRSRPQKTRRSSHEDVPRSVFNTIAVTSMSSPAWVESEWDPIPMRTR